MKIKNLRKIGVALATILSVICGQPLSVAAEASLDEQIANAQQQYDEAEENYDKIKAQYELGMVGFVDWMLARTDLSTERIYDLNSAKTIYTKAQNEDFSEWADGDKVTLPAFRNGKVTCTGDEMDAISIRNTKRSIQYMYELNTYREKDTVFIDELKCGDAYVDFQNLAYAQTEADRVAGISTVRNPYHASVNTTVECLAFGSRSPILAWGDERGSFLNYRNTLGYTPITSLDQVEEIQNAALADGIEVRHYTGMFYTNKHEMKLIGIGCCEYGSYGMTHCYGASPLTSTTKNGYYTVAEFEAFFNEYCETIDIKAAKQLMDEAKERLDALLQQRYDNCSNHSYTFVSHTGLTCTENSGDLYVCSKCGKNDFRVETVASGHTFSNGVCQVCSITAPTSLSAVYVTYGGRKSSLPSHAIEEGTSALVSLSYKTASANAHTDKFDVIVDDPDVLQFELSTTDSWVLYAKKRA